jgi:hypothetical protein
VVSLKKKKKVQDLAKKIDNRQPVGYHPGVSVMAAEKRYQWFMSILCSDEGGPLGIVQDKVVKKEYQRRGAVHWHMLLWVKPGTAPSYAVMAEMPRSPNTDDVRAAYVRKIVEQIQQHKTCYPTRCFRGVMENNFQNVSMGFHSKFLSLKNVWMMMVLGTSRGCSSSSIQSRDSTFVGCSP